MSGIYGLWYTDQRPIAPPTFAAMEQSLAHRGPDGSVRWLQGHVGLGCQCLRYTPESFDDVQIGVDDLGTRVVFDGRLDNREELKAQLGVTSNRDTDLILAAYRRHGERFAGVLNGEYAIAIFDPTRQKLLLARDVVGTRPLYYAHGKEFVAFGSEVKAVLPALPEPVRANVPYLAVTLVGGHPPSDGGPTFFEQVLVVIPGRTLICERDKAVRDLEHWDFEVEKEIRYKRDEEYAEALREHFRTAVRRRARSRYPIAVSISGGLDSSSILCTAEQLRREEPGLVPSVIGLNQAGPAGSSADERQYLAAIERDYGVLIEKTELEFPGILPGLAQTVRTLEAPVGDISWRNNQNTLQKAREHGARTVLFGHWGDQVLFDASYLADLCRRLRWATLTTHLRDLPGWMDNAPRGWLVRLVLRQVAKSYVPTAARSIIISMRRRTAPMHRDQPWFTEWFRNEARREWPVYRPAKRRFASQTAQTRYQECHARFYQQAMEGLSKYSSAAGMEFHFPFLDRDLLQFMMLVPGDRTAPAGVHRGMMRNAMKGTLPEEIRTRRTKANLTSLHREAWKRHYDEIVNYFNNNDLLAREGYINQEALESTLGGLKQSMPQYGARLIWDISDLLGLDEWVRQFIKGNQKKATDAAAATYENN